MCTLTYSEAREIIALFKFLLLLTFVYINFSPTKINSRIVDNFKKQWFNSKI